MSLRKKVQLAARIGMGLVMLWLVYGETGPATTAVLALLLVQTEAAGWITLDTYRRLDALDDSVRLLLGVRRTTAAGESAAETTKGNP